MKNYLFHGVAIASLAIASTHLKADDELIVYVLKDGLAYQGVTVVLDNAESAEVDMNGMAELDLTSGGHSIQILDGAETIHSFRFDSAAEQFVDITVVMDSGTDPQVGVENFYANESALDRSDAPLGGVSGTVYADGAPASGAEVELGGEVVFTDAEGAFLIEVPRGVYDLLVIHDGNVETVDELRVVTNVVKQISPIDVDERAPSAGLSGIFIEAPSIEEVTIVGTFNPSMFGESEQFSSGVVNTMGAEELARFGGGDVAASVGRMPSVSVQDDKYLFIRGLGGRYITTTLNASTLPSTDPNKRTVPLDLFPTNMVDQLDVKKTFLAYMPGESTGGNLEINTRAFPDVLTTKISVSLGGNSDVTGDSVAFDSYDGDFDIFGFEDGSRGEPGVVSAISTLLNEAPGATPSFQLDDFVETTLNEIATLELIENMDLASKTANPDMSASVSFGGSTFIDDYEVGVYTAVNYANTWSVQKDGIQRSYAGGSLTDDYTTSRAANNIDLSGLLSLGLNIGNHSYEAVTMLSRATKNETSTREGLDGDALQNIFSYTTFWEERQFISQQIRGEHYLGDLSVDWQVTGSQAWRYAPDRREVRFDEETEGEPFVLSFADSGRNWEELTDTNSDASVDLSYDFQTDWESRAEFGASTIHRERLTESATYGFVGNAAVVDDAAPNMLFSDVINESSVTGDQFTGFAFTDETLPSDAYDAEMDLHSAYISWENNFSGVYEFIVGARYEDYIQTTNTFELTGDQNAVQSEIDESVVLPSFSFNWYYSLDQQLRLALSETVSRPDFKESSNAVFYDVEFGDVRVRGNPDIQVSSIKNYDLRWEMYGEGENKLSVALFYKDIEDAIERVALSASGTAGNSRTFENADSAEISGVELDFRQDFGLNDSLTRSIFVAGNLSLIDSESIVEGAPTRALQGQPDYTANLILGWDDLENDQELTVIFAQNGESIRDVGTQGLSDIIEEPRMSVSLSYSWKPTMELGLSAKIQNLLDEDVEYTQDGEIFQSYGKGISFNVGLDYEF